jgi:hypothetical protein
MLIKIQNGIAVGNPILEENFKMLFPSTSFPRYLSSEDVEPFDFAVYEFSQRPESTMYKKVIETSPLKDEHGIYRQTWSVVDMNDTEKAAENERKASEVRAERNWKLSQTDWTQVADASVDQTVWAKYRQALRDTTNQEGFPWTITWPTQPE